MNKKTYGLYVSILSALLMLTPSPLLAGNQAVTPLKEEVVRKTRNLQVPFIANVGQADERVKYYAKTFGGTVYITREGDIMYMLPKYEEEVKDDRTSGDGKGLSGKVSGTGVYGAVLSCFYNTETIASLSEPLQCRGAVPAPSPSSHLRLQPENSVKKSSIVVLKESLIGAKISEIQGEGEPATKVSYFKGNDPSLWKSYIVTYNYANLGEVYEGFSLKLKAHGNNVENKTRRKPGPDKDQPERRERLRNRSAKFQNPNPKITDKHHRRA